MGFSLITASWAELEMKKQQILQCISAATAHPTFAKNVEYSRNEQQKNLKIVDHLLKCKYEL